jgi:hypothetical protein
MYHVYTCFDLNHSPQDGTTAICPQHFTQPVLFDIISTQGVAQNRRKQYDENKTIRLEGPWPKEAPRVAVPHLSVYRGTLSIAYYHIDKCSAFDTKMFMCVHFSSVVFIFTQYVLNLMFGKVFGGENMGRQR